jgi:hypothetical protein
MEGKSAGYSPNAGEKSIKHEEDGEREIQLEKLVCQ